MESTIKLFISYSHKDEELINNFRSHLAPLKTNGTIKDWYDRKINAGDELQTSIDNNLADADIICLMISSDFLSSSACLKEKSDAIKLMNQKGIRVIPIILRSCDWISSEHLPNLLCLPTDAKPIKKFPNEDDGWLDTIGWLKRVCQSISQIKKLQVTEKFSSFLNSPELLTKSHKAKEELELEDIFVYPTLKHYDNKEESNNYESGDFENEILSFEKIIIAGENQAGKTTLCKKIFETYIKLNFIPIYLNDESQYLGNPDLKLEKAFKEQYQEADFSLIEKERIVPIVDDFHFAKHPTKYVESYDKFQYQVLMVDDIFGLSLANQAKIKEYSKFKIKEFNALKRDELIGKWITINEASEIQIDPNHLQRSIDEKTEKIESYLGLLFGKGVMPSYPFFILSILASEDINKPLNSAITSQGYCYQALIYLYLRREGVKENEINAYLNFLTELAYELFEKENGDGLSKTETEQFLKEYETEYVLPTNKKKLLQTLTNVNLSTYNSLGQYHFTYVYLYYFFVAKYFAENIIREKEKIDRIFSNLHKDENAYIATFMAHHSNSDYLLDEIILDADIFFEEYNPATLNISELDFFDKHQEKIVKAVLPSYQENPEEERQKLLQEKAKNEEDRVKEDSFKDEKDSEAQKLNIELRRSIKTGEVMGLILKNRAGSLNRKRLEQIYESGLNIHLRILTSFIEIIKVDEVEKGMVNFLKERINGLIEEKEEQGGNRPDLAQIEKFAKTIYWNMNFGVLHGFITKAIHSLGSSGLIEITQEVSNRINSPSAFIVNEGIIMWYAKNLRIGEMENRIKKDDFSYTAKILLKHKVVEHCRLHKIDFSSLQKIESKLKIPARKLMIESSKYNKSNKKH